MCNFRAVKARVAKQDALEMALVVTSVVNRAVKTQAYSAELRDGGD